MGRATKTGTLWGRGTEEQRKDMGREGGKEEGRDVPLGAARAAGVLPDCMSIASMAVMALSGLSSVPARAVNRLEC